MDYCILNKFIKKDGYPLPCIHKLLDLIGWKHYLLKIDLLSEYQQVLLIDNAIPKTAFNIIFGKFKQIAILFNLANAPITFQLIMNRILSPWLLCLVIVYLDDILVFLDILEEYYKYLKQILTQLHNHQLYTKLTKYIFTTMELEFYDYIIGNSILQPVPAKLNIVCDWSCPQNI